MRNQKWNQFDYRDQEFPETPMEAAIFLHNAIRHLNNRINGPLGETFNILNGAHDAIATAMLEKAVA